MGGFGTSRSSPAGGAAARRALDHGGGRQGRRRQGRRFYPLDVERVFRSLDRIKPHIKTWWSDNSQAQQLTEQEEVDLIYMTNGRATQSILDHKAAFEMIWNESWIYAGHAEGWIVPVGCPNPQGGMRFLDIVGRPEHQAVFARLLYYAPQHPEGFDLLEPKLAKLMPSYPENEKLALHHQLQMVGGQQRTGAAALRAVAAVLMSCHRRLMLSFRGAAKAASPESIITGGGYGFGLPRLRSGPGMTTRTVR